MDVISVNEYEKLVIKNVSDACKLLKIEDMTVHNSCYSYEPCYFFEGCNVNKRTDYMRCGTCNLPTMTPKSLSHIFEEVYKHCRGRKTCGCLKSYTSQFNVALYKYGFTRRDTVGNIIDTEIQLRPLQPDSVYICTNKNGRLLLYNIHLSKILHFDLVRRLGCDLVLNHEGCPFWYFDICPGRTSDFRWRECFYLTMCNAKEETHNREINLDDGQVVSNLRYKDTSDILTISDNDFYSLRDDIYEVLHDSVCRRLEHKEVEVLLLDIIKGYNERLYNFAVKSSPSVGAISDIERCFNGCCNKVHDFVREDFYSMMCYDDWRDRFLRSMQYG